MNKKQLFLWALYDFANSLIYVNFLLYFAQWLVIDAGLSDFWYNAIFAITTLLLLLTAPTLAALTDRHGHKKLFLNLSTVGTGISYAAAGALAAAGPQYMLAVALLFLAGQYFYQLSFVFYNPMLEDIAAPAYRSRASGIGQFANSLGQVTGILVTLPLAGSRTAPLLPAVALFAILALPMMIFFKEQPKPDNKIDRGKLQAETRVFLKKMAAFFAMSAATPMLVAFFFFNDALLTISNNYAIYLDRVFAVADTQKSILLMAILAMSAIGGIAAGWLGDKIGLLKTLKIILLSWIIALPIIAVAPNFLTIAILTPISGLLVGSVWTVTRAYLSVILHREHMAYGFSFYAIVERFATFVGPVTWGAIIWIGGSGPPSYRVAMAAMTGFVIIGLAILMKWKRAA